MYNLPFLLLLGCLLAPRTVWSQDVVPASGLTASQQAGKLIYTKGTGNGDTPVTAILSGREVNASLLPCQNCHGLNGEGNPEGGIFPSNITWEALTKPYGKLETNGRAFPPYTERSLKKAITLGLDPAGNDLNTAMPRYRMSHQQAADLIAYIKVLGKEPQPGITDKTVTIGLLVSSDPNAIEQSNSRQAILKAYADAVNAQGGVFNRKLEILPIDRKDFQNLQPGQEAPFVLIGGPRFDVDMRAAADRLQLPVVGAVAKAPEGNALRNRYVFYLYPSEQEQFNQLMAVKDGTYTGNQSIAIVRETGSNEALAEWAATYLGERNWAHQFSYTLHGDGSKNQETMEQLHAKGVGNLIYLGSPQLGNRMVRTAAELEYFPHLLILGTSSGLDPFQLPAGFRDRVHMAFPTWITPRTSQAMEMYAMMKSTAGGGTAHRNSEIETLAAALMLTDVLRKAGRRVSREQVVEQLESFYEYATGLIPPQTYTINERIGSKEVFVLAPDFDQQTLKQVELPTKAGGRP